MKVNLTSNVESIVSLDGSQYKVQIVNQSNSDAYLVFDDVVTVGGTTAIKINANSNTEYVVWGAENAHLISENNCEIDVVPLSVFYNNFRFAVTANVEQKVFIGASNNFFIKNTGNNDMYIRVNGSAKGNQSKSILLKPLDTYENDDVLTKCHLYLFSVVGTTAQITKKNLEV